MIIFCQVAKSLSKYLELMNAGKPGAVKRPRRCRKCGGEDCFWAHGCYWRTVEEDGESERIAIERFKCSLCGKTVSALPCFVIPWRRYAVKTVADGIEGYATKPETYKEGATKLGAEGPSPAQLYCWVALLVERVKELLLEVQGWCATALIEDEMLQCEASECPNSWKARIPGKAQLLDNLAKLIGYGGKLMRDGDESVMQLLGMRFLKNVEQLQQIFARKSVWKQTPQRTKP